MARSNLTVGKVAKLAAVNIQTVRYYERIGLVKPDARRDSGYRLYTEEAAQKIRFIKHAQQLGFSLAEIAQLLRLRVSKTVQCEEVRSKTEARLRRVGEKIESLRKMAKVLEGLTRSCRSRALTDPCPILRSLEEGNNDEGVKGGQR